MAPIMQPTSHTRAAMFAGKLVAGILAQALYNFHLMNFKELNYITLGTQIIATIWAFGLPKVKRSLYFHRQNYLEDGRESSNPRAIAENNREDNKSVGSHANEHLVRMTPFKLLWTHFKNAYTNIKVVQWSIWYAVGLCGYLQVLAYVQVLWKDLDPNIEIAWNGAVKAVFTALAALSALAAGYIFTGRFKQRTSLFVLAALSVLEGGAILLCCLTKNVYISYVGFILFGALYAFTITVASAEVARYLEEDSFGLVFGINTLLALILQTMLTLIVVSESGYALSAKGQFTTYGSYFIVVGIIYFVSILVEYFVSKQSSENSFDFN